MTHVLITPEWAAILLERLKNAISEANRRGFRFDPGHRFDLMSAAIPNRSRPPEALLVLFSSAARRSATAAFRLVEIDEENGMPTKRGDQRFQFCDRPLFQSLDEILVDLLSSARTSRQADRAQMGDGHNAIARRASPPILYCPKYDVARNDNALLNAGKRFGLNQMRVSSEELEQAGRLLAGDNWQRSLARMLAPFAPPRLNSSSAALDDSLVRKWKRGERPIPEWVGPALATLLRRRAQEAEAFAKRFS